MVRLLETWVGVLIGLLVASLCAYGSGWFAYGGEWGWAVGLAIVTLIFAWITVREAVLAWDEHCCAARRQENP